MERTDPPRLFMDLRSGVKGKVDVRKGVYVGLRSRVRRSCVGLYTTVIDK